MNSLEKFMQEALNEAKKSLKEGNHGFGCVIIKNGEIISRSHDREESDSDPTSHAEINAVRLASKIIGKELEGCILLSTHEPCPMCSGAIIWSGIRHIAYGYSIEESIKQGRKRINLTCSELFKYAGIEVKVDKNVLYDQCSILYRKDVRDEIKRLLNHTPEKLKHYNDESGERRLEWFKKNRKDFSFLNDDPLDSAYNLLLCKFNIESSEAQIVEHTDDRIVFHSKNFCPTLEACKILGYDTGYICRNYNENSTDTLIKQINKQLKFGRNYNKLRPSSEYCEEMIFLENDDNNGG
jgi:tRNA(adenine34) deaminase